MPDDFAIESSRTAKRLYSTKSDRNGDMTVFFSVVVVAPFRCFIWHIIPHTLSRSISRSSIDDTYMCLLLFKSYRISLENRFCHLTHNEPYQRFIKYYNWNTLCVRVCVCARICIRVKRRWTLHFVIVFGVRTLHHHLCHGVMVKINSNFPIYHFNFAYFIIITLNVDDMVQQTSLYCKYRCRLHLMIIALFLR